MPRLNPRFFQLFALTILAGVLAGLSSAVFLHSLELVAGTFRAHPRLVWLLPLLGLGIGWFYHHFAGRSARGHNLILDEIHKPGELVPARMAPVVLGATLLTHLGGGSAGREGAAVQISAALADQLGRIKHLRPEERRALLMAGAGAGFGSAIGAPIAGIIFGMEMIRVGRFRAVALGECVLASVAALITSHFAHTPHSHFPHAELPGFEWHLPIVVALAGILFGLAARLFVLGEHAVEKTLARAFRYPPLRTCAAGLLLAVLFTWEGTYRFCGLGIEQIQAALRMPASWYDPVLKLGFTALTIGGGFKGGEFVPLVWIGATLGSVLAAFFGLPLPLLASVGFAAVFGAGANTPIACAVMAGELFGWGVMPYALVGCYTAYLVSGHPGLYKAQPRHGAKHEGFFALAGSLGLYKRSTAKSSVN